MAEVDGVGEGDGCEETVSGSSVPLGEKTAMRPGCGSVLTCQTEREEVEHPGWADVGVGSRLSGRVGVQEADCSTSSHRAGSVFVRIGGRRSRAVLTEPLQQSRVVVKLEALVVCWRTEDD